MPEGFIPGNREDQIASASLAATIRAAEMLEKAAEIRRGIPGPSVDEVLNGFIDFVNITACEATGLTHDELEAVEPLDIPDCGRNMLESLNMAGLYAFTRMAGDDRSILDRTSSFVRGIRPALRIVQADRLQRQAESILGNDR
jgi:hypothetical protein